MAMQTRNIMMVVSYDGTSYSGFQKQRHTKKQTIQEVLENALAKITGHAVYVKGSGRTDAGVHALAQVVNFHTHGRIPTARIKTAVNSLLPCDIVVKEAREADRDFHARFFSTAKTYLYQVCCAEVRPAIGYRYFMHHPGALNLAAMEQAAAYFPGEHDFSSFCASGSLAKSTVRNIYQFTLEKFGNTLYVMVTANGFLYQMMRRMVGTLLAVGEGRIPPERIPGLLSECDRKGAGRTAPPQGLILARVYYDRPEKFPALEDFLDKGLYL
ncbi:MAG: tRNA pseudouridine(38-40) synthase TruA [Bacillota bacterium]